MTNIGRNAAT